LDLQIPQAFTGLVTKKKRLKVYYGGRGGAKSQSIARVLLALAAQKKMTMLCLREFQSSINDSLYSLLVELINELDAEHLFKVKDKTIEGESIPVIDIAFVEEAESVSEHSLEVLMPTVRTEGSEIWIAFNPVREDAAVYQQFVAPYATELHNNKEYEDDYLYVRKVNFDENPYLPDVLDQERLRMKETDSKKYNHVWLGDLDASYTDAIIQPEWFDAAVGAAEKLKIEVGGIRAVGFDPADEGQDAKCLVGRTGSHVTHLKAWDTGDLYDAIGEVYVHVRRSRWSSSTRLHVG